MARPYSNDLRERVATSVALGRTCRQTADLFGVSVSSVVKWSQRQRSTGTAAALPMGGNRGRSLERHREWLLERIAVPGMTVRLLAVALQLSFSISAKNSGTLLLVLAFIMRSASPSSVYTHNIPERLGFVNRQS